MKTSYSYAGLQKIKIEFSEKEIHDALMAHHNVQKHLGQHSIGESTVKIYEEHYDDLEFGGDGKQHPARAVVTLAVRYDIDEEKFNEAIDSKNYKTD